MCHAALDATAGSWGGVRSENRRRVDRKTPALGRRRRAHSGGWALHCQRRAAQRGRRHCLVRRPYGVSPRHKIWRKISPNVGHQSLSNCLRTKTLSTSYVKILTFYFLDYPLVIWKSYRHKSNVLKPPKKCEYTFFLTGNTVPTLGHSICLQYRPHCSHPGGETQRSRSGEKRVEL